ncbi:hypothetical protein GWK47_001862 [Chionoecetes opilio]|uniref:Uncharacterized protein n=1 Tax=Chionoecetes opilio TaxID=41210 RepID=A0A8J4XX06_CHIOP|nr:hypothetical protein GWK47_001862 [Chionoecetes opilio]
MVRLGTPNWQDWTNGKTGDTKRRNIMYGLVTQVSGLLRPENYSRLRKKSPLLDVDVEHPAESLDEWHKKEEEEEEEEEGEVSALIPGPGDDRTPRVGRVDWCDCKKCPRMATEGECFCCHEDEEAWLRVTGAVAAGEEMRPLRCIVEHPFFTSVCLNPYALEALYSRDVMIFDDEEEDELPTHDKYRLTAFRAFVEYFHGTLQEEVKGPVPACAATTIRDLFPPSLRVPGYSDL